MAVRREVILQLYRSLIRESKKWSAYNYRMFALRKVRDEFEKNKMLKNEGQIKETYGKGLEALEMIKRQVIVGNLYSTRPLVIENKQHLKKKIET